MQGHRCMRRPRRRGFRPLSEETRISPCAIRRNRFSTTRTFAAPAEWGALMPIVSNRPGDGRRRGAPRRRNPESYKSDLLERFGSGPRNDQLKLQADRHPYDWICREEMDRSEPLGPAEREFVIALARWAAMKDAVVSAHAPRRSNLGRVRYDQTRNQGPAGPWGYGMTIDLVTSDDPSTDH